MSSRTSCGPADRVSRAIVVGVGATFALLLGYLASYALAHLFALASPSASLSQRLIAGWLQALSHSEVANPAQPVFYAVVGLQIAIGLVGAAAYAWVVEPRFGGPARLRGLVWALALWLVTLVAALPVLGAGVFGDALGAGPLPAYATLVAYAAYGLVLGPGYAASEDIAWVSGVRPGEGWMSGWVETARGLGGGAILGGSFGLALGLVVPWQGQVMSGSVMPLALMLSLGLAGAAVGQFVGSLSALPTVAATLAVAAGPVAVAPLVVAEPLAPVARLNGRYLRVVGAHGICSRGYVPGQTFRCGPDGDLDPAVCPAAREALRPLVSAMVEGRDDAPRQVCCPVYDHMLVFELVTAAA